MSRFKITYLPIVPSVITLFCLVVISSCGTIKNVPQGEYLLTKSSINDIDKSLVDEDAEEYLRQRPNSKILGLFAFHLWLFNRSANPDSYWHRVGEKPVIYSKHLTQRTVEELSGHLENIGYYNATVTPREIFKESRAEVIYDISAGKPHRVGLFNVSVKDSALRNIQPPMSSLSNQVLFEQFNSEVLEEKRKELTSYYRNRGFYDFEKSDIRFQADTIRYKKDSLSLRMIVGDDKRVKDGYRRYKIDHYIVSVGVDHSEFGSRDTIYRDNFKFIYRGDYYLNPDIIIDAIHLDEEEYYKSYSVERTYSQLNKLRQFKLVGIRFQKLEREYDNNEKGLVCNIKLTPSKLQSFSLDLEGTNTSGSIGGGIGGGYRHKNIFGGGEILDLSLNASIERQRYGVDGEIDLFNTQMYGVDMKVTVPKFLVPFYRRRWFKYEVPSTQVNLSYNYQKRPDFTRTIVTAALAYKWNANARIKHYVAPIDVNLVKMFELDPEFLESIQNLSIKSSYTSHSIFSFNYAYTYNSQQKFSDPSYKYLRWSLETSGNLLYGISSLTNGTKHSSDSDDGEYYHFFGTPYSQYAKLDGEFRKGWEIDKVSSFTLRAFAGVAVPYGNSTQMPFERKYFSGGANSVRGWGVRTLGPGTYQADPNEFPNQTGDIKLEFNGEYRFHVIGYLEGALFIDAGNVWSLNDNREGAEFDITSFYSQFAVSPGVGLRIDFNYAVMRLDLGMKSREPSAESGERWVWGSKGDYGNGFQWNFAIGYPF